MAVAWIGSRETLLERACQEAAMLLKLSRCPVSTFDMDVHGTRAAIALAERVGAAYDHVDGAALSRETALFTDKGAMTVAPGEVRRRADVVAIVGELPAAHGAFVDELAATVPDLSGGSRTFFSIGAEGGAFSIGAEGGASQPERSQRPTLLFCDGVGLAGTLAALRSQCGGRQVSVPVSNFDKFESALRAAKFPVFLFSGYGMNSLALEMLQGLIADINRKSRASSLHLPASDSGWGSTLASTWMTGFPPRTGFARGFPEFDPWRFDVTRMIASGEADLHLWICPDPTHAPRNDKLKLIALTKTEEPVTGAAITVAIGQAGVDHEAVVFSSRHGTLTAIPASKASELPPAATILRLIAEHIAAEAELPC